MKNHLAANAGPAGSGPASQHPGRRPDLHQGHAGHAPAGPGRHPQHGALRVLRWLAAGHDLPAIARRLGRDPQRLGTKVQDLLTRLNVSDAAAALQRLQALLPQAQGVSASQDLPAEPTAPDAALQQALADDDFEASEPVAETADGAEASTPAAA